MKIADIQFYSFNPGRRNLQVVRVESDNGYYGWGEAGCARGTWRWAGRCRTFGTS